MIVSFNPDVFETDDEFILENLSQLFDILISDRHLVDIDSIFPLLYDENAKYIFDEGRFSINYLSIYKRGRIEEYFEMLVKKDVHITRLHEKYLTEIIIGLNADEISPQQAIRILNEQSIIIVENATNDWKFIKGITKKYKKHPKRREIYSKIKKAIDNLWIRAEQAGGKSQILTRYNDLSSNLYQNISQYKLMTVFDSDRNNNLSLDDTQKSIIDTLKGRVMADISEAVNEDNDLIAWHMLYKRELENYIPVDVLINKFTFTYPQEFYLRGRSANDLDFIDFDNYLNGSGINVKTDFPELFLEEWERDKLESRCEHHKVDIELPSGSLDHVSEIEQILLKIAKII